MDAKTRTAEARERYHHALEREDGTGVLFALFDFLAAAEDEALEQLGINLAELEVRREP